MFADVRFCPPLASNTAPNQCWYSWWVRQSYTYCLSQWWWHAMYKLRCPRIHKYSYVSPNGFLTSLNSTSRCDFWTARMPLTKYKAEWPKPPLGSWKRLIVKAVLGLCTSSPMVWYVSFLWPPLAHIRSWAGLVLYVWGMDVRLDKTW